MQKDSEKIPRKQNTAISEKFGTGVDLYVEEMKTHGAGLSTNADYKKRRYRAILEAQTGSAPMYFSPKFHNLFFRKQPIKAQEKTKQNTHVEIKPQKRNLPTISCLDEEEELPVGKQKNDLPKKKLGKDPTADTGFLPDVEREQKLEEEKQKLIEQFMDEQKKIQNEICEIAFAYSEYPSAKRTLRVKKNTDIGTIINKCRLILAKDFKNMEYLQNDALMFTKENIVLPKECTIYDCIVDKVKGENGELLFDFNKRKVSSLDENNKEQMIEVDIDKGSVARITERKQYAKNKHLYPYRTWKEYNPAYIEKA